MAGHLLPLPVCKAHNTDTWGDEYSRQRRLGNIAVEAHAKQKLPWYPKEVPSFYGDRAQGDLSGCWLRVTVSIILVKVLPAPSCTADAHTLKERSRAHVGKKGRLRAGPGWQGQSAALGPASLSRPRPPVPRQPSRQAAEEQPPAPTCCPCRAVPPLAKYFQTDVKPDPSCPLEGSLAHHKAGPPFKVTQPQLLPVLSKRSWHAGRGRGTGSRQQQMGSNVMSSGTRVTHQPPVVSESWAQSPPVKLRHLPAKRAELGKYSQSHRHVSRPSPLSCKASDVPWSQCFWALHSLPGPGGSSVCPPPHL